MGAIFLRKKRRLRQRTHKLRASKTMGAIFLEKKKRLRQRTHKLRASKNMGAIFLCAILNNFFPCGASARVFGSLQSDLSTATLLYIQNYVRQLSPHVYDIFKYRSSFKYQLDFANSNLKYDLERPNTKAFPLYETCFATQLNS